MSISIFSVPVPSSGDGAPVDISALVGRKSVILSGTFKGSYVLLGTHDGVKFDPLLAFDAGGNEGIKQTFDGSLAAVKIRSLASSSSGVSAQISGISVPGSNSFGSFASLSPGTSGPQPSVDLGLTDYQSGLNFIANGNVQGSVVFEGSLDNVKFNPIGAFTAQPSAASLLGAAPLSFSPLATSDLIRYVRLNVQGAILSPFTITFGGSQSTGGGGGQPSVPTIVNSSPYALLPSDTSLQVTGTVTIPIVIDVAAGTEGREFTVTDSAYNCTSNNITLVPAVGDTINGEAGPFTMGLGDYAEDGLSLTFAYNTDTSNWEIH